jgi:hypothetical protein
MGSLRRWSWISLFLLLISSQSACLYSKTVRVGTAALLLEDVATAAYKQSDLRVIREGMPAYLMLMDGMIEAWPDNERLLIAAAQAYSSGYGIYPAPRGEGARLRPQGLGRAGIQRSCDEPVRSL